mgnify:CR=1 FL=1
MKVGDIVRVVRGSYTLRKGDVGMIVEEAQLHPTGKKEYGVAFGYNSQGVYPPVKTVLPLYIEVIG